jgi:hypothetical protein
MILSAWRRWFHRSCFAKTTRTPRQPLRFRPSCEHLENRLVPATWTGANYLQDSNWSDPLNWAGNMTPGPGDVVYFTKSGTQSFTSTVDTGFTVAGITIDSTWGGGINVNAGLTVTGNFALASGIFGCNGCNGAVSIAGRASTWTGGGIYLGSGGFTNSGTLTIDTTGGNLTVNSGGTLTNSGTIKEKGGNNLFLYNGATLSNTGTFDFTGDASVSTGGYGKLSNTSTGTVEKTGGRGTSTIGLYFINTGGTIDAESGTLALEGQQGYAFMNGGVLDAGLGGSTKAVLELAQAGWMTYTGSFTGSGSGTVTVGTGYVGVASAGATFNFPGTLFKWTEGTIDVSSGGTFTNATGSVLNLDTSKGNPVLNGSSEFGGTLANNGTINEKGGNDLFLENSATLSNAATFDFTGDASVYANAALSGYGTFTNAGTCEKTKGTGTSTISTTTFGNTGTVSVKTGTVDIAATVTQVSGGTLTGGSWTVLGSATVSSTLDITSAGALTDIGAGASVTLNGLNTTFSNLSGLSTITAGGSFTLAGNQSFTTSGDLSNSGHLTLSPGSILTVSGSFTEASIGKLTLQMGAVGSSTELGTVVSTTGTVSLAGSLTVTATAIPAVGSSFEIVDNEGDSGISGNFARLPEGATFTVKDGTTIMTFQITYVGTDTDGSHNVVITRIA